MFVLSFVRRWIALLFIPVQRTQVILIIYFIYALPLDFYVFLRLLEVAQVAQLRHLENALEAPNIRVITLPLISYQFNQIFHKSRHHVLSNCS